MKDFIGIEHPYYARILFAIFAAIAGSLFVFQLGALMKLKLLPVFLLPILSFCILFHNVVQYEGSSVNSSSILAKAADIAEALVVPLFIIIIFEMTMKLHQARFVHFLCIPFDQSSRSTKVVSIFFLWIVRSIACGLFVMNFVVYYPSYFFDKQWPLRGGYCYLARHPTSLPLWLSLIPPMCLSFLSITMGVVLQSYGKYNGFRLENLRMWRLFTAGALCQACSHIFYPKFYPVVVNAGETALLLSTSFLMYLSQEELTDTVVFADYLRQSNLAFSQINNTSSAASTVRARGKPLPVSTEDVTVGDVEMRSLQI